VSEAGIDLEYVHEVSEASSTSNTLASSRSSLVHMTASLACLLVCSLVVLGCKSVREETPARPAHVIDGQVIDGQVIDGQVIDAQVIDAQVIDAPVDASPADAAIDAPKPKRKPRAKSTFSKCLEDCRKRNQSRHCMDDEGMTDCPCNCN
jgi:hypothetical protein